MTSRDTGGFSAQGSPGASAPGLRAPEVLCVVLVQYACPRVFRLHVAPRGT